MVLEQKENTSESRKKIFLVIAGGDGTIMSTVKNANDYGVNT